MPQELKHGTLLQDLGRRMASLSMPYSLFISTKPALVKKTVLSAAKDLIGKGVPGLFVSFNRPYALVKKELEKAGVDTENVFFVDCVSSATGEQRSDNVLFLNSPSNLTGLSIGITQFIEAIPGDKFILIDTLQTLSIYVDSNTIAAFIRAVSAKTSRYPVNIVTISTPNPVNERIIPFFDEVIEVDDV